MDRILKLLDILGYPNKLDIFDKNQFILCVNWLEDRKIRELEIIERDQLRNENNQFDSAYSNYLEKIGCPFKYDPSFNIELPDETLFWLISYAISVEYEDCSDRCRNLESELSNVEFSHINQDSQTELMFEIEKLGIIVDVNKFENEDIKDYLKRLYKKVRFDILPNYYGLNKPNDMTLDDFDLGFSSASQTLDCMAKVLKMIYILDLRELQSDLNSLIALGQEYTANPKINSSLGKVGR